MWASFLVYAALGLVLAGVALTVKPVRRLCVPTRSRALGLTMGGLVLAAVGLALPAIESRASAPATRLDEFSPVWQFAEFHSRRIAAPPDRVYQAVRRVRADDIAFFNTLTWIRRGGRPAPVSILNAGDSEPILEVATRTGFLLLADEPPREIVIGTAVVMPPGTKRPIGPELFRPPVPSGFALVAMNFLIAPEGSGSLISTETRVFASSADARRVFARYWRVIYPGSAIIRRMWLRAIEERAMRD